MLGYFSLEYGSRADIHVSGAVDVIDENFMFPLKDIARRKRNHV